jgi:hypothetical protein
MREYEWLSVVIMLGSPICRITVYSVFLHDFYIPFFSPSAGFAFCVVLQCSAVRRRATDTPVAQSGRPKHLQCSPGASLRLGAWLRLPPSGLPRLLGAVRFAAGRPKHPQRSPGDRKLRNAIRAPLPPPNGRKPGRNAVILAVPFQKKRGCQDCVAEVSVARTALRMFRSPAHEPNCAAVFLGAS